MFSYAAKVDIGVHEEENDDRVLVGKTLLSDGMISGKSSEPYLLATVCDGVGGLSRGYRAAEITLDIPQTLLPTQMKIGASESGLSNDCVVWLAQIRTVDQQRLKEKIGHLDKQIMQKVDAAISESFGLCKEV